MEPTPTELENALRKSFAVIQQLKLELAQAQAQAPHEPIAIVAMACRFPGGANSPEAFWQALREGRDCRAEIPPDRWDWRRYYNPDPGVPGTHYVRHGYFVDRIGDFDPEFFGIAGREAASLDPQHRLLLETSWEALERAGLSAERLRASRTGVFVGIGQNDYAQLQMYGPAPERITPYDGTGISFCFAAARLSYTLGLNGPNLAVDTACSSSLVALHLACNSLAQRECDQALVGGSHLIVSPEVTIYLSRLKALSPDGRSKAFSADADGYGRGEGCGMLLVKRLADARRDGDPVLAVVRGSAVNHGGASSGLTVPSGLAQQTLLRDALTRARLTPAEIGWIEAHGTGTALGDPIEVNALSDIFRAEGRAGHPLYLSSVKTNIGHLEAAAGIAGVIKAVLALQHGEIPPHLHLGTANPQIDWQHLPFRIPTIPTPWDGPRAVGVSAFGLGGTNAHVILSAPDAATPLASNNQATAPRPLLLSARTPAALAAQRDAFADLLAREDAPHYVDIAQTAALGRRHFEYRLGVAASDASSAAAKLRQAPLPQQAAGSARGNGAPRIAFLFTGQGSQYCGMGQALWRQEPAFRAAVEQCAALVEQAAGWSPLPFIRDAGDDPRIDQTAYTQPALFTLQVGLVSLWRSWGIAPDMVIGHSIGEFAAAWCAGILSLEDAARLVVERGRLMQRLPAGGGMAALRVDEATAHGIIAAHPQLALAAINGPRAVTIAGPLPVLEQCLHRLEQEGTLFQRLPVSHAFHSGLMEPMLPDFTHALSGVRFARPGVEFIATGADTPVDSAIYWRDQIRNPVRFSAAAARLATAGAQVVIEIGPAAPLLALARQSVALPDALWLPSLERHNPEALADSLAKLYAEGVDLRWQEVFAGPRHPALLPTYPFQRRRCWVDPAPTTTHSVTAASPAPDQHPLLGAAIPSPLAVHQYDAVVSSRQPAFLAEHRVRGQALYPAAAFVEMALAAAARQFGQTRLRLREVEFLRPLPLTDGQPRRLQLVLTPQDGDCAIAIHSCDPQGDGTAWQLHMRCRAQPLPADAAFDPLPQGQHLSSLPGGAFYEASRQRGIDYGPAFQTLHSLDSHAGDSGSAAYALPAQQADPRYLLPPVLLDTGLQALAAARPDLGKRTYVPAAIARLDFTPGAAPQGRVRTRIDQDAPHGTLCSLQLPGADGQPCVAASGIDMRPIDDTPAPVWLPRWQPATAEERQPAGRWLLLGDDLPTAEALGARLRAAGCTVEISSATAPLTQGVDAVCCLSLHPDDPAAPASRELALIQQLGALPEPEQPALLFATRGAQAVETGEQPDAGRGALWGLARVARNEYPALRCRCVDLDPVADLDETAAALFAECAQQTSGAEDQTAWRQRSRVALRLQAADPQPATSRPMPGRLICQRIGDLDSLDFAPWQPQPPGPGEVQVRVRAASLNFKDVLHVLGALALPEHGAFGFDAAGVVEALGSGADGRFAVGDRVMLSLTPGALGDVVNARGDFVCPLPDGLDFASGAALPLAYLTAWHALVTVAKLQAGEHVLIHAAAGGVGQAAVAVARLLGAHVHATASPAKHGHLRQAGLDHIYNSRDTAFREQVRAATGGAGVDVVLNCLNGDAIAASFDGLKHDGRFIEIGKAGIWNPHEAQAYRADVAYAPFDLADVAAADPARIRDMFALLARHLAEGRLPPLPVRCFAADEVGAAFRLMSRSRHIGKVVVSFPPAANFDGVQVISGGFGALGRLLGQTLAARGATQLALLVHKAPDAGQQAFLDALGNQLRVAAYPVDLADAAATRAMLERIAQDFGAPVRAIYHTAGVLSDHPLAQESPANFAAVAAPKLLGAWHLHLAARGLDLQRFVLFSSAAALIGTPGQGSYATANAGLDALAAARRGAGLPALSINWGPWGGTGMAARLAETGRQRMAAAGIAPLRAESAFDALFRLDAEPAAQALVMDVDWRTFLTRFPGAEGASLYRDLRPATATAAPTAADGTAPGTLVAHVAGQPAERRRGALFRQLQHRVAAILGRPSPDDIAPTQGFFALGMDSLTSMELRTGLQRDLGIPLPATLTFDYGSIEALADHLLGQVPAWRAPEPPPPAPANEALADLSEDELAAMLARELEN